MPKTASQQQPPVQIYISNISEDVWSFISAMSADAKTYEIEENKLLSDRELFSCGNWSEPYFILPATVSAEFLEYYKHVFQHKHVEVMTPEQHSGEICLDILKDEKIINRLLELGQSRPIELVAYSSTYQFLKLVTQLEKKGVTVLTPESPKRESYWTTNFFGSKTGLRQLLWKYPETTKKIKMPDGYIGFGNKDIASMAADTYERKSGAVIKTAKGHAGQGVMIIPPGSLSDNFEENRKRIKQKLTADPYWNRFPTVVENFINIDKTIGGGNPNVEFFVDEKGIVQFLYSCGMRVTPEGVFKGVEIHENALPSSLVKAMTEAGQVIGQHYSDTGYRGYFDVDCVVAKDGTPYIAESNVRRTGGTHVYHTLHTLVGPDFMHKVYTVSTNIHTLPGKKKLSFPEMLKLLKPLLYDKNKNEGVILISANLLSRRDFGYIVIGKNKDRTLTIEAEMEATLTNTLA